MIITHAKVSISHPQLTEYTISTASDKWNNISATITAPNSITIQFKPFKIKPMLRIDNILVNYWLANVQYWDHEIKFELTTDFWIKYYKKETDSQIDWAHNNFPNDPMALDKFVGRYNSSELIDAIKQNLNV